MLHHNTKNRDEERKVKKIMEEQEKKKNYKNALYIKVQQIAETLGTEIDKVTNKKTQYGKSK